MYRGLTCDSDCAPFYARIATLARPVPLPEAVARVGSKCAG